jgi:hypothetical protein
MLIYAIKVDPPKSQATLRRLERDRALIRANEAWRADRIHRPRPKTTHARNAAEVPDLLLHLLHRGHKDWRHGQLGRLRGLERSADAGVKLINRATDRLMAIVKRAVAATPPSRNAELAYGDIVAGDVGDVAQAIATLRPDLARRCRGRTGDRQPSRTCRVAAATAAPAPVSCAAPR